MSRSRVVWTLPLSIAAHPPISTNSTPASASAWTTTLNLTDWCAERDHVALQPDHKARASAPHAPLARDGVVQSAESDQFHSPVPPQYGCLAPDYADAVPHAPFAPESKRSTLSRLNCNARYCL